jgi:NADH-quinone oxidoreductase subunit N
LSYSCFAFFILLREDAGFYVKPKNFEFFFCNGFFHLDLHSLYFCSLACVSLHFLRVISFIHNDEKTVLKEDFVLFTCLFFALIALVFCFDLLLMFVVLAAISFCLYVLLFYSGENFETREAGVKYFYLSAVSSGLLLYGIFLMFFLFGTLNYSQLK